MKTVVKAQYCEWYEMIHYLPGGLLGVDFINKFIGKRMHTLCRFISAG